MKKLVNCDTIALLQALQTCFSFTTQR